MLDPEQDRDELSAALRDCEAGLISLPEMRTVSETIVDRWRDRSLERPPFTAAEIPLWNVVWDVITGCRESLDAGGVKRLRGMLEGTVRLSAGGPELRP